MVCSAACGWETAHPEMKGAQPRRGAVSSVSGVRNRVSLAGHILEAGRHSFFAGPGALARARELGVPLCDPTELVTEHQRRRLAALQAATVGPVALDRPGTIAGPPPTRGLAGELPARPCANPPPPS